MKNSLNIIMIAVVLAVLAVSAWDIIVKKKPIALEQQGFAKYIAP